MADDDEPFDIDTDSDVENDGSDDDTDFFPIDETIVPSSQPNTTSSQISKPTKDPSTNKYSTGINYPQDNNFEYVGKF